MVLDDMLVEGVGRQVAFRCNEAQLLTRDKPQQVAFAAAMRAVTLRDLAKVTLDLEGDMTAMTAAFVGHRYSFFFAVGVKNVGDCLHSKYTDKRSSCFQRRSRPAANSRISNARAMQSHNDYESLAPISSDVLRQSQTLSHPLRIHMGKAAF